MHYLGQNFVLMIKEAHKQAYLNDSPLHADMAAALESPANQPINSPDQHCDRIDLTLVEAVFDALTERGHSISALREQLKMTGVAANFTSRALYILTAPTFFDCARVAMHLASTDNNVFTANVVEKNDVVAINVHFHVETSQLVKEHIMSVINQFTDFLHQLRKTDLGSALDPIESVIADGNHPLWSVLAPKIFQRLPFSIVFEREMLEQANPFSNPREHMLLSTSLQTDTSRSEVPLHYTRLIMAQIAHAFEHKASTQLKDIADLNNISEATLKRKLSIEGSSFIAIKASLRADQALLLLEEGLPQESISDYLQYACPTGFSRSFKAWYGVNATKIAKCLCPESSSWSKKTVI